MPANVLFTNPVVAQQSMAADQYALQQRAQELADRNTLLENIRLSQDSARQSGDRRYQTDAYRSTAQGQNDIGMVNARTAQDQGDRRLSLDQTIAENEKSYRADQLATQKAIAEINANAAKLRPQDVATIGKTVELHNSQADEFNNTAPNAALIIKNLADELKKTNDEAVNKTVTGKFVPWGPNKKEAEDKIAAVPYSSYIAKALQANPTLVPYVEINGDKLSARSMKKVTVDNSGRLVEIDPLAAQLKPAPAPVPQASWQSRMADSMSSGQPQPAQQFQGVPDSVLSQFGGGNPAALIQGLNSPAPQISGGMGAPAVLTNKATGKRFTVTPFQ